MKLKIATRQSPLALAQTREVQMLLEKFYPYLATEQIPLSTKGDQIQDRSLAEIGGKGLFIKTLEEALKNNAADLAVHSLKDVPPVLESQFALAAVLPRSSPCDTLVSTKGGLDALPKGAVIGTSSVRRRAQLLHYRPDLNIIMLRGNVQTRLNKLKEGLCDAVILAEAGLIRLGLTHYITEILPLELFVPSVGQGVLAVESLRSRQDLLDLFAPLNDITTFACISAERSMNAHLCASCTSPVGSFAEVKNGLLKLHGVVLSRDGQIQLRTEQSGPVDEADRIGQKAAQNLLEQGAKEIL